MRFASLTNPSDTVSLQEAIERGAPQDPSSLYMPEYIPQLPEDEVHSLIGADPVHIGKTMLRPYTAGEIPEEDLDSIVHQAVTFDTPVVDVGDKKILELFHGPTMAFKDVAARYLALLIGYFSRETTQRVLMMAVTSGDTAGAIAEAFADVEGIDVAVIYPKDRVSLLQREQLRRVAQNVHTAEMDAPFSELLKLGTTAFANTKLRDELNLTTANSVSLGRWLPQTTYYAGMYSQVGGEPVRSVVPTGNQGNISAAVLTDAMGVSIPEILGANNKNDVLTRYLAGGIYDPHKTIPTFSNAMDIGDPRNWARLKTLCVDIGAMRQQLKAAMVTDEETAETIVKVHDETGYVLDPHTAVAWRASEKVPTDLQDVIVSTASKSKFAEEIYEKTGIEVDNSRELEALRKRPERYTEIAVTQAALEKFLLDIRS